MSIMDSFRNALGIPGAPNGPNQMVQPGNLPGQMPAILQGSDGQVPSNIPQPPVQTAIEPPKSPLDEFNKMWDPIKTDPNAPNTNVKFNIDPTKVNAAAAGINFTKDIDPALMLQINKGGPEAIAAMIQLVNTVGQKSFAESTMTNAKLVETALARAKENMAPDIAAMVRSQQIKNELKIANPMFSNPTVAPVLAMIEQQMTSAFPTATPAEITQKAQTYLTGMASEITKVYTPVDPNAGKVPGEVDWGKFELS